MQQMASEFPPTHVTSDIQVMNLLEITKTHEVRLCVSSLGNKEAGNKEAEYANEVSDEGKKIMKGMIIWLKMKMMMGRRMLICLMLLKRLMMVRITVSMKKIKDEDEEEKVDMCMAGHNRFTPG